VDRDSSLYIIVKGEWLIACRVEDVEISEFAAPYKSVIINDILSAGKCSDRKESPSASPSSVARAFYMSTTIRIQVC
jgi:hypothetical protein